MKTDYSNLTRSPLFMGLSPDEAVATLHRCTASVREYAKGEYVVRQGDTVRQLYLPICGSLRTEMITKEGNVVEIDFIEALRPLAPAFLFADRNMYPVDVIAAEPTTFHIIEKDRWLEELRANELLLLNFMRLNSNVAVFLSNKVQMMSIKSLKGKLALHILERTTPECPTFPLTRTLTQLADHLGVQRPSLSRTMGELVSDGLITWDKREITVLNRFRLECLI